MYGDAARPTHANGNWQAHGIWKTPRDWYDNISSLSRNICHFYQECTAWNYQELLLNPNRLLTRKWTSNIARLLMQTAFHETTEFPGFPDDEYVKVITPLIAIWLRHELTHGTIENLISRLPTVHSKMNFEMSPTAYAMYISRDRGVPGFPGDGYDMSTLSSKACRSYHERTAWNYTELFQAPYCSAGNKYRTVPLPDCLWRSIKAGVKMIPTSIAAWR